MPYRRFGLTLFLLCSLPTFFPTDLQPETRRALLVGIDKYQPEQPTTTAVADEKTAVANASPTNPPPARSGWFDLDGAVNDVEAVRAVLIARYGFQPDNVHVLRNQEATR